MAAPKNQLERIFNTITGDTIKVEVKRRDTVDTAWDDAIVTDERLYDISTIDDTLTNGDSLMNPKTYGIWKALSERISDGKSLDDKLAMMDSHFENFQDGKWKIATIRKASNGSDMYLIAALMELKGLTLIQATEAIKPLTRDQVDTLKSNPRVMDAIQAARLANNSIDGDALVTDLLGDI